MRHTGAARRLLRVAPKWLTPISRFSTSASAETQAPQTERLLVRNFLEYLDRPAFISPEATVAAAIDELVSLRVGSLLACGEDGDILGIFTTRDVLRKLAGSQQVEALKKPVSDILTDAGRMVWCSPNDTVADVRQVMRSQVTV